MCRAILSEAESKEFSARQKILPVTSGLRSSGSAVFNGLVSLLRSYKTKYGPHQYLVKGKKVKLNRSLSGLV